MFQKRKRKKKKVLTFEGWGAAVIGGRLFKLPALLDLILKG